MVAQDWQAAVSSDRLGRRADEEYRRTLRGEAEECRYRGQAWRIQEGDRGGGGYPPSVRS